MSFLDVIGQCLECIHLSFRPESRHWRLVFTEKQVIATGKEIKGSS